MTPTDGAEDRAAGGCAGGIVDVTCELNGINPSPPLSLVPAPYADKTEDVAAGGGCTIRGDSVPVMVDVNNVVGGGDCWLTEQSLSRSSRSLCAT